MGHYSHERILGDGDFVKDALAAAEEKIKRRYAIQKKGINLEIMANRVTEIFDIPPIELWASGKHRWRVRANSVLWYWANRDLEISMSKLARRMDVSVMAVSNAVRRGEKIAEELNISLS